VFIVAGVFVFEMERLYSLLDCLVAVGISHRSKMCMQQSTVPCWAAHRHSSMFLPSSSLENWKDVKMYVVMMPDLCCGPSLP